MNLLILLLLASFASVCAVLYTPALPDLAQYLNISNSEIQKSLSIFLIGYACGNLLWGPLANRYGRKGAIAAGLVSSIIGILITLLIIKYPSVLILNLGRFIQALGASVGIKIAFTYISDFYSKEESASKIAYLMLSFAIVPGVAIALGGILTKHFGWASSLYATLYYSIFLFLVSKKLPETLKKEHIINLSFKNAINSYRAKLSNKKLVKSSILMGCGTSFIYLFASMGPFIATYEIGLTPAAYGFYNFIPPTGMILGFYLTQALKNKFKAIEQIKLGVLLTSVFTSILMFAFLNNLVNPWTLFLPIPGIYLGLSLVFSNSSAISIQSAHDKSNASAMTNFLNMAFCVLVLFGAESIPFKASIILSSSFGILTVLMFILWDRLKKDII